MKKLLSKSWVQVILIGGVIGAVLIIVDNKFHIWNKKSDSQEEYNNGLVGVDKDKTYFTTAEYAETEFNFGKIKEGDTVRHVFKIKNTGKEPLFVYKAVGSCECVRIDANTVDPVAPGAGQDITVFFLSKGRKGPQVRTATIDTNTDPSQMILTLKGEVE